MPARGLSTERGAGSHQRYALARALVVAITMSSYPSAVSAVSQDPPEGTWGLRFVDRESEAPLAGVHVSLPDLSESRVTDSLGVATVASDADSLRIVATRVGYARMDTVVARSDGGTVV